MGGAVKAIKKVVKKATSVLGASADKKASPQVPGAKKVASKADEAAKLKKEQNEFTRNAGSSRRRTILSGENLG